MNTHQPLAKLVSSWMERQTCMDVDTASYRANIIQLTIPKNMRIHVDNHLVNAIQDVVTIDNGKELVLHDDLTSWDAYWESEAIRIASNTSYYGGTAPKGNHNVGYESNAVNDSRDAIEELKMLDLIVGFHPDQVSVILFCIIILHKQFIHRTLIYGPGPIINTREYIYFNNKGNRRSNQSCHLPPNTICNRPLLCLSIRISQ